MKLSIELSKNLPYFCTVTDHCTIFFFVFDFLSNFRFSVCPLVFLDIRRPKPGGIHSVTNPKCLQMKNEKNQCMFPKIWQIWHATGIKSSLLSYMVIFSVTHYGLGGHSSSGGSFICMCHGLHNFISRLHQFVLV